ncbi:MAG: ABC transporter permease [bacterium]
MVKTLFLFRAMLWSARRYRVDWWGSFLYPLLAILPAAVIVWLAAGTGQAGGFLFGLDKRDYFGYLLIGATYWNYVEILWSSVFILRESMRTGQFEDLFATPISGLEYIIGWTLLGVARVTLESVPLLLLALAVNILSLSLTGALWSLLVFVLSMVASFGLSFALFGLTLVFKEGDELASLVGNAAPFLGGLFFPVTILPAALQWVALAFPFTWGIDLIRHLWLGSQLIFAFETEMLALVVLAAGFLLLGTLVYQRMMRVARVRGVQGF